jgi:DNA-binding MarR family transcriptional regulator
MADDRELPARPDPANEPLGAVLDFMRLLWGVDHGLQSASKRMEASLGVTGPQRLVVRIVGRYPGIAAGRLAEILHVHPSTLTGILKRLESRGVIERKSDPRDGRRALFGLTAKGRRVDTLKTGTVEQAVRRVLAKMPDSVDAAQGVLAALAKELSPEE